MQRPPERNSEESWPDYLMRLGFVGALGLLTYWAVDGVMSGMHEDGGMFSFIPRFFGGLTAIGVMIALAPAISNWAKNSGVPWVNDKASSFGQWIKGALPAQKTSALDEPATAPQAAPTRLGELPQTEVRLSSVAYGGHVTDADTGQLSAQAHMAAQAETPVKQAALSA